MYLLSSTINVDVHSLLPVHVALVDGAALTQYPGDTVVTSASEPTEFPLVVTVNSSNVQLHCPVSCGSQSHFFSIVLEVIEGNRSSVGHPVEGVVEW